MVKAAKLPSPSQNPNSDPYGELITLGKYSLDGVGVGGVVGVWVAVGEGGICVAVGVGVKSVLGSALNLSGRAPWSFRGSSIPVPGLNSVYPSARTPCGRDRLAK